MHLFLFELHQSEFFSNGFRPLPEIGGDSVHSRVVEVVLYPHCARRVGALGTEAADEHGTFQEHHGPCYHSSAITL